MGVIVAANATFSVAANAKSTDQVSGQYQFIGKGNLNFWALSSAVGLNCTLKVNGVSIIDDKPFAFFGTTGALSKTDNLLVSQLVQGGRVELFFRNTTGGALTVDYQLDWTATK